MMFLDEKIAELQKKAHVAKKYNGAEKTMKEEESEKIKLEGLSELTQEEVTEAIKSGSLKQNEKKLDFENKTFFEEKITIPIFKDFFDEYAENESAYCWSKKYEFSVLLYKSEFKDEISNANELLEKFKTFFKENDAYIEFLSLNEEKNDDYSKYIINSRMPTAIDYIYQYMVCIKYKDEIISLIFTCLEKEKNQWEKIMVGISELMEINIGAIEDNE